MFDSLTFNALRIGPAVFCLLSFVGCLHSLGDPRDQNQFLTHKVRFEGESLSAISKWYTGSAKNWSLLERAEPNASPGKLNLGEEVLIPQQLVIRSEIPKKTVFLASSPKIAQPAYANNENVSEAVVGTGEPSSSPADGESDSVSSDPTINRAPMPPSETQKPSSMAHPNLDSGVFHELKLPN
jgi:hypothetical protein